MELFDDLLGSDTDNFLTEDGSIVVDADDFHTVHEGSDVELGQEGGFGLTDDLSLFADLDFLQDFDLSLLNFGGDVEGMEERNLRGVESGGSGGDVDVLGCEGSDFGGGFHLVLFDEGLEFENGFIGEDESDLALHQIRQSVELGDGLTVLLIV